MAPKRRTWLTIEQKGAIINELARLVSSTEKWSLHVLSLWTKASLKLESIPHCLTLSELIKHDGT